MQVKARCPYCGGAQILDCEEQNVLLLRSCGICKGLFGINAYLEPRVKIYKIEAEEVAEPSERSGDTGEPDMHTSPPD